MYIFIIHVCTYVGSHETRKDRGKILGEIYVLGDIICDLKVEMGLLGEREDQQGEWGAGRRGVWKMNQ